MPQLTGKFVKDADKDNILPAVEKLVELGFSIIPKAVDEYWQFRAAIPGQELDKRRGHPHGTLLLARRACLEEVGLFLLRPRLALTRSGLRGVFGRFGRPTLASPPQVVEPAHLYLLLRATYPVSSERSARAFSARTLMPLAS